MRAALARARGLLAHPVATLVCDIDGTLADDVGRRHLRPKANPHCLTGVDPTAFVTAVRDLAGVRV